MCVSTWNSNVRCWCIAAVNCVFSLWNASKEMFSCFLPSSFASNLTYFSPPSNFVVKKWNFKMNLMCSCYFFKYFVLRSGNFLHRCDTIVVFKKLFLFTHVSFGRSQHTTGKICCRTLLFLSFWRVLALFAQSLFKLQNVEWRFRLFAHQQRIE